MVVVSIKNLKKYYKFVKAVDDITLEVEQGEIFGFVGQNGAGKSTTIKAMLSLINTDGGEIKIFDKNIESFSKEINNLIGYSPSEITFPPSANAKQIFEYTLALNGLNNKSEIDELCDYFELNKNFKINKMSFGNRKKVSLIQALIKKPKLLILDEPTNGLDPLMQERLFLKLKQMCDDGCTVFLSSHNLGEVEKYCDRVGVIKKGKLMTIDAVENIVDKSLKKVTIKLQNGETVVKEWKDDSKSLLEYLLSLDVVDFTVANTSVQEEFMKYYAK